MFKILKRLTGKDYAYIGISTLFIALQVWLELEIPGYMTKITRALETPGTTTGDILDPGSKMILYAVLSLFSSIIVGYFAARVAGGFAARLRKELYDQVLDYSTQDITQFSVPSLLTRSTNDITQLQMFIAIGMQVMIKAPITAVWAMTKIAGKGWQWSTATAVAVVALIVMLAVILTLVQPRFKIVQRLTDRLNLVTRENLNGIRVVHAYNAEKFQNDKFDKANNDLTDTNMFALRALALMNPGMSLISSGLTLAVYAIGAYLIDAASGMQKLTYFSNMIVFSSYAMQIIFSFLMLSFVFVIMPRVTVSAGRINEVLAVAPSIKYPATKPVEKEANRIIEFKDVSFHFSDAEEAAVKHLTFKTKPGQTLALIGSTGSGKSTVLNLIARRYEVSEGQVLIDGVDVSDYPESDLNDKIGYAPQKAVLFSGDIRSNIDFGTSTNKSDKLSDDEIKDALDTAQALDFVERKHDQLDANVAQHGDNFSGGQKQRLAIARAVARKPEILMFDDSFSALDYATDRKLRETLNKKNHETTKVIVAQRISTIMDADQIIVLDNGNVAGIGTHDELLKDNKVYQEIAYSQLSKEELA
ncbi:ABC transporter ATP-binding protein [Secundilactobacillus malefermentans]|uniref:ABC transporter ATP-binding protein n=1 Tax=Secundilactobacillus malefermentans TaxID=176292 RepID=UPI0011CA727E|nr:ABC transporter ATP-binding protein [Secundilactobacillus malefermentans]QEA31049.1 ABC transporter ATP-binding protein [Secundilactobacillus malefermentans]